MKIMLLTAVVSLVSAFAALFPQNKSGGTKEIIKELERQLAVALLRGDQASVDKILADDYIEITSQGSVRTKAVVMSLVRARAAAPRAQSIGPDVQFEEIKFSDYGDTAILIGLKSTRYRHMEYQSSPDTPQSPAQIIDHERFTKVYIKRKGRWQLVASQTTAVVKNPTL